MNVDFQSVHYHEFLRFFFFTQEYVSAPSAETT